jgi:hypothetical protein
MNTPHDTATQAAEGRDRKERTAQAHGRPSVGLPGNPFARKVAELRAALVNFITADDMKHLAFVLKMRAEGGDMQAMKLLFQYVLGKPVETVDPDRLDVDEWQKMQEKSRPPEEATKVLGGLPAQTVCEVTKVACFRGPQCLRGKAMSWLAAKAWHTTGHFYFCVFLSRTGHRGCHQQLQASCLHPSAHCLSWLNRG